MIFSKHTCALVVDDDPILVQLASSILLMLGLKEVLSATSGATALDVIESKVDRIDLVLCDLQMPEMDGIALLRELGVRGYKGAVVVVSSMTGPMLSLTRQLATSYGLDVLGTLKKPLNREALRTLLGERVVSNPKLARKPAVEVDEAALRHAIDNGEVVAHYQPKLDVATGRIAGAEALARWIQPGGEIIAPDHFVPLAERIGLIAALDRCVMRTAIADLPRLRVIDASFCVAVNASGATLSDLSIYDMLTSLLKAERLGHSSLTLEITERQALCKSTALLEVLGRLRLAGFELAIDDFGTGHSNLETLKEFPFTELKIDQSFIKDAPSCSRANATVDACLLLGRKLGMNTVAEGVETDEHWQFLRGNGALTAQGYFIARPMPIDDLLEWMSFRAASPAAEWTARSPQPS